VLPSSRSVMAVIGTSCAKDYQATLHRIQEINW
jgi:hypothetical protein